MDTSVTLIGIGITLLIAIPLYKAMRANSVNKSKIRQIMAQYPDYRFDISETLNKKVYALDEKKKGLLLIDFNFKPERTAFINLHEVSACRVLPTTENFSGETVKIELEFIYKDAQKRLVPVYHAEHDQITQVCLHEDQELAKKWQQKIILTLAT